MPIRTLVPFGLSLLSIAIAQTSTADPCDPAGGPPTDIEILIGSPKCSDTGSPDCSNATALNDAIAARDGNVLQIEGNHSGTSMDALEHWQLKVALDISAVPDTGFHVFVDLRGLPAEADDYHWYDEAVLVCAKEDVTAWAGATRCPAPPAADPEYLVLRFHFPAIPSHCLSSAARGSETVRVLWRGALVGDYLAGRDDRQIDRLGIEP